MRDLIKFFILGFLIFTIPSVFAKEQYKVLILPDNIVSDTETVDSYIYNGTSEFFASEIINLLNQTDYIKAPTVSAERSLLKSNPASMISARNLTNKFKTTYNIDFLNLKKIAAKSNAKYVLLLTTAIDAENYITRRTFWDFLNIAGASVLDPAYKLNTYAALVDIQDDNVIWSKTFYKTISACENRIITRGPSPQTVQLEKIRDYSRMICPEIAENVQKGILSSFEYIKESDKIYYDMGNFDNVFTKKYRRWYKEGKKDLVGAKSNTVSKIKRKKRKSNNKKRDKSKRQEVTTQLEVIAEPVNVTETPVIKESAKETVKKETVNKTPENKTSAKQDAVKKETTQKESVNNKKEFIKDEPQIRDIKYVKPLIESDYDSIDIKKTRKNSLIQNSDSDKPKLRDYN